MAQAAALTAPIPEASQYSKAQRWVLLVALMLSTILEVLDTSIVNVSIPDMMGNLGVTVDQINWVSTGYIVANVIVLPLTGWLANQFGRRNYLVGSIILFTIASLLCGTAHTLTQLVMYRIIQGAGGAALLSTSQATLIEVFPRAQVPMIQAIFSMGLVAAPTFGPTVGGYITVAHGWPWIFFINVPIGIIAAFMVWAFLKDSPFQRPKVRIDLLGIGLLALGLGCFQTFLEEGKQENWFESPMIIALAFFATLGMGFFIWWELRTPNPAVRLAVLRHRSFAAGAIFAVVLGMGLYGGVFILPIFLQQILMYDPQQTGWLLMPGGLVTALSLPIIGKISRKFQPRSMVALGTILFAFSMYLMHEININTGPRELVIPLLIRGAALALMFLPLSLATLMPLPPQDVPYATGLFNLMRQLGGSAGIAALATYLTHQQDVHRAMLNEHLSMYNPATVERMNMLTQGFIAKGSNAVLAKQQAMTALGGLLTREAAILAFEDCFWLIGIVFIFAIPLLLLFKKVGKNSGPAPAMDH